MVRDCESQVGPQPPLLNVIFHGPFLFIYYPDRMGANGRVEVVTPDTPEHVAVAGTWLGEKLCRPGTYYLTGIKTTQKPLKPDEPVTPAEHAVIDGLYYNINIEQGSYYRFILPLPSVAFARSPVLIDPSKIFIGTHAGAIGKPTSFGTVHVLSYLVTRNGAPADIDAPQLEGLQWLPMPSPYKSKEGGKPYSHATNLHVYAEAPFVPDLNHPIRDFKQMMTMLPGIKLGVVQQFPNLLTFTYPSDDDTYGIIREEQGGLRGLPPTDQFRPPLVCDTPSLVVKRAQEPTSS
jgi:hypothetical protein